MLILLPDTTIIRPRPRSWKRRLLDTLRQLLVQ